MQPSRSYSFTVAGDGLLNVLKSEDRISLAWDPNSNVPVPPMKSFNAIWDTGAMGCVITQSVIDSCDLAPTGVTKVFHAQGESTNVDTFLVNIQLPNEVMVIGVPAMKGFLNETDALIGMNIINQGDFAVTNLNGKTKFSFRYPSLVDIDFVEEERNT